MDASRLRQRIRILYEQLWAQIEPTLARAPLLAAYLYEHRVQCGKPQCRCAEGRYRHRMWCVSYQESGRSRTRVVSEGERAEVEARTQGYARFRQARREIEGTYRELRKAVDALGRIRCQEGRRRYARRAREVRAPRGSPSSGPRGDPG